MQYLKLTLITWNIIVFLLFAVDKYKAVKKKNRISEFTLVFCSVAGGGLGAILSMIIFNHKTKKPKFRFFIPISLFIWIYIFFYVL